MKDLYETLGVTPDASAQEIKKAFRSLALGAHPDKGGDAERMGLLNEAYQTLSDPERRHTFDSDWEAYQSADVEQQPTVVNEGYLEAGNSIPYSHKFRIEHQSLVALYEKTPLTQKAGSSIFLAKIPERFSTNRSANTMPASMRSTGSFIRKRVVGDGNCLFYSIIEGLNAINQNNQHFDAKTLREFVAEKIRLAPINLKLCGGQTSVGDDITDALRELRIKKQRLVAENAPLSFGMANNAFENKSDYINYIKTNFSWASMLEVNIIAHYLNIRIRVNDQSGEQLSEISLDGTAEESTIYVLFSGDHYDALIASAAEPTTSAQRASLEDVRSFESECYQFETIQGDIRKCHDIYTFIHEQTLYSLPNIPVPHTKPLTPELAIKLFTDFLSGMYFGMELAELTKYFSSEIRRMKSQHIQVNEHLLYEGIFELVKMSKENQSEHAGLVFSIKKITDFTKNTSDLLLQALLPLFYNKFFRNLHAYALHSYWNSNEYLFEAEILRKFNGYQESKELLDVLSERLSSGNQNENLSKLIQYVKLIFNYEKDQHEASIRSQIAADHRGNAFHFLDWLPVLMEGGNRQILVNLFLQIGIKFQQASRLEKSPAIQMADEKLALKMYLNAAEIGHHTTPDVDIYANTQAIKYISAFQFQDVMLDEILPALKKRTLIAADVFPFFETHQSNVAFVRHENRTLHLMRKLLNAMINAHEYNKTHADLIPIDHSAVTILYQAYEACIKNWYQEEFDPDVEKQFRLELMEELLFENGWTSLDVEQQIDSPWIMVDRDEQGWLKPTRSLPYKDDDEFVKYRTINGVEINNKTGEIHFFMTHWTQDRPVYEKLFTLFDLQEMLEKNISGAIFSLDPVDPYKSFHPYNLMRFAPSQLCESELLNTMLLTDYVLKFLTTNQEVQGQYPFDQRPVSSMIEHLPEYLRQIITDFHNEQHAGALHRFWIEAEEIDVLESKDTTTNTNITKMSLGNLKMVVKKHRMERDIHGELKDVGNEDEGWPVYVLTREQMTELQQGSRVIDGYAMIFIYAEQRIYFWENNQILKEHITVDYKETLIRLFKQTKNADGKVEQNTKNMPLIYRATKDMAQQVGLSHRYSSEFIFAHEFTTHYDVFAQYLPEFGRLKELSKISVLIRLLSGMRASNQETLQAINYILSPGAGSKAPITDAYTHYNQVYNETQQNIVTQFSTLSRECSTSALWTKQRDNLKAIKEEIGTLNFGCYSDEVNTECERQTREVYRGSRGYSFSQIETIIDGKRSDIASQFTTSKRASVRRQLIEAFSSRLSSPRDVSAIDSFIDGNITPLVEELISHEKKEIQKALKKQFPDSLSTEFELALDNINHPAVKRIATAESRRQLMELVELKEKIEAGFVHINLGKDEEPVDLEGKCLWVPASVRHEVGRDDSTGLTRYSFFVYGGVSVQPRINVVAGRGGALSGNSVGGGAFNRNQVTKGFQDHHIGSDKNRLTRNHELWRLSGVDVNSRVNKIYLPKDQSSHGSRSVHSGRHTNTYSQSVAERMDKVILQGRAAGWTQEQYRSATRQMFSELRQDLRSGNIGLNKNMRSWAKKW